MLTQLRDGLTVFALACAMILAGVVGIRHVVGTTILLLLSFAWFTLDHAWEGGVIIDFGGSHGLTQADLGGLIGLAVAGYQLWRHLRAHRR